MKLKMAKTANTTSNSIREKTLLLVTDMDFIYISLISLCIMNSGTQTLVVLFRQIKDHADFHK